MPVAFTLNGRSVRPLERNHSELAKREGVEIPHLCYTKACARTATPSLRGWIKGDASGAVMLPISERWNGSHHGQHARADEPEDGDRAAPFGHSGTILYAQFGARSVGETAVGWEAAIQVASSA